MPSEGFQPDFDNNIRDRSQKYGWGSVRLFIIIAATLLSSRANDAWAHAQLLAYLNSMRWICHLFYGGAGALLNSGKFDAEFQIALLILGLFFLCSELAIDNVILVYFFKTIFGDILAGKIDSFTFQFGSVAMIVVVAPLSYYLSSADGTINDFIRIFFLLFGVQFFCEYGDKNWDRFSFFRYRYSFEVANALILAYMSLSFKEISVIHYDLVACWSYRVFNYALIQWSAVSKKMMPRKVVEKNYKYSNFGDKAMCTQAECVLSIAGCILIAECLVIGVLLAAQYLALFA
jgi:hypothetical protein